MLQEGILDTKNRKISALTSNGKNVAALIINLTLFRELEIE